MAHEYFEERIDVTTDDPHNCRRLGPTVLLVTKEWIVSSYVNGFRGPSKKLREMMRQKHWELAKLCVVDEDKGQT
jgi:hypothetical protein